MRTPKCDKCGKRYWIKPWDRLPAMIGLQSEDGKVIYICKKCLCTMGAMETDAERDEFLAELWPHEPEGGEE